MNIQGLNIQESLKNFLVTDPEFCLKIDEFDNNENLVENGTFDSLKILKIIAFIEETFSIEFKDDDIIAENFASISAICNLVSRYKDIS